MYEALKASQSSFFSASFRFQAQGYVVELPYLLPNIRHRSCLSCLRMKRKTLHGALEVEVRKSPQLFIQGVEI